MGKCSRSEVTHQRAELPLLLHLVFPTNGSDEASKPEKHIWKWKVYHIPHFFWNIKKPHKEAIGLEKPDKELDSVGEGGWSSWRWTNGRSTKRQENQDCVLMRWDRPQLCHANQMLISILRHSPQVLHSWTAQSSVTVHCHCQGWIYLQAPRIQKELERKMLCLEDVHRLQTCVLVLDRETPASKKTPGSNLE